MKRRSPDYQNWSFTNQTKSSFVLLLFFNDVSTFMGYLIQSHPCTRTSAELTQNLKDKRVYTFHNGISLENKRNRVSGARTCFLGGTVATEQQRLPHAVWCHRSLFQNAV